MSTESQSVSYELTGLNSINTADLPHGDEASEEQNVKQLLGETPSLGPVIRSLPPCFRIRVAAILPR